MGPDPPRLIRRASEAPEPSAYLLVFAGGLQSRYFCMAPSIPTPKEK